MRMIDLFCGCGGMRLAFSPFFQCALSCDIDRYCRQVYTANFGEEPQGDIKEIRVFPEADVVCGGFPCQEFSRVNLQSKGLGSERGQLYQEVIRVVKQVQPAAFFAENVPGIKQFLPVIAEDFRKLGYSFCWKEINAKLVWPQLRNRVYMIGLRDGAEFQFPDIQPVPVDAKYLLEESPEINRPSQKHWDWLADRKAKGYSGQFTYRYVGRYCPTLLCGDNQRIFVDDGHPIPRRLTVRERARIQGFPDSFQFPCSKTQAKKQLGNSVCIPIVQKLAISLYFQLTKSLEK